MGFLSFLGGKNPADAAAPYLDQIPDTVKQYYNPFIEQGNQAYNTLNPQFTQMASSPTQFLEYMMKGYEPSRAYQLRRDETQRAAGNTAAAGGMRGSVNDITNQTRLTDALLGEDMQQWLQNVLGIQQGGMQGLNQFYNAGYGASGNLASDLSNVLGTQASLAFQGQANKNQMKSDMLKSLMSMAGGIAGMPMTGGGSFGGAMAGNVFPSLMK